MQKNEHFIVKLCLMTYACLMFSLSVFIPVFDLNINEEGKRALSFLQEASFAWVSGPFMYFFGKVFLDFLNRNK